MLHPTRFLVSSLLALVVVHLQGILWLRSPVSSSSFSVSPTLFFRKAYDGHVQFPYCSTKKPFPFYLCDESNNDNDTKSENYNDSDNDNDNDEMSHFQLQQRIQELYHREQEEMLSSLSNRLLELEMSDKMQQQLTAQTIMKLPVLSMDAMVPNQVFQGRTEDAIFGDFLSSLGLGNVFVMISLDPTKRLLRRNGVICKIVAMDVCKSKTTTQSQSSSPYSQSRLEDFPTAVDFEIQALSRCRVIGPTQSMKRRIGRWRRSYDPNGEESMLGWGMERFLDIPTTTPSPLETGQEINNDYMIAENSTVYHDMDEEEDGMESSQWSSVSVQVNLEALDKEKDQELCSNNRNNTSTSSKDMDLKMQQLYSLVEEWYNLASNSQTFHNINVTAMTRIRKGQPGLWVDPQKLLRRVSKQLGPAPIIHLRTTATTSEEDKATNYTAFLFWATAMINPLPPLGVSLEIRGPMLEATTLERRIQILEYGLHRSIDNLKGKRPL